MPYIKIPTAFNIDLEFEAADLGKRLLAWVIDFCIRAAYFLLVLWLCTKFIHGDTAQYVCIMLFGVLPVFVYFLVMEWVMGGQTPGKMAMSIKVVSLMGNQPTIGQHLLRWLMRMVESPLLFWSILPVVLPLIMISRSAYGQRLGDLVAGTIVVSTKVNHTIQDTIFRDMSQTGYQPQFLQILKLTDKDLNKVKELLDRAVKQQDLVLASRVAERVKMVLKIETNMNDMQFLETLLNDYNYLVTRA